MKKIKIGIALVVMIMGALLLRKVWVATSSAAENQTGGGVFYGESVRKLRSEFEENNEEAIVRFESRIQKTFDNWRATTPEFVEDLTDLGSKTKMAGMTISDLIDKVRKKEVNEKNVEEYVRKKFEYHFFTEEVLNKRIQDTCNDFAIDLEANRKRFYADLKADWDKIKVSETPFPADEIMQDSLQSLLGDLNSYGNEILENSTTTFVASEMATIAAGYVGIQVASQVAARFGGTLASAAAASGGAAGVGTAGGGAGGSTVGPGGMIIGAAVGFTAGLILDWWMTERMQEKITIEINNYLTDMEESLINGSDEGSGVVGYYKKMAESVVDADVKHVRALQGAR